MSVKNEKVCCNCRHNIRKRDIHDRIICECEVSGKWLGYLQVMTGWCRHWAKEKEENIGPDKKG